MPKVLTLKQYPSKLFYLFINFTMRFMLIFNLNFIGEILMKKVSSLQTIDSTKQVNFCIASNLSEMCKK